MNKMSKRAVLSVGAMFVLPLFVLLFAPANTQAQAPANSKFCAYDFEICEFQGDREVIYGANNIFVRKVIKGGSVCLPATFGVPDPVPNVRKSCFVVSSPTAIDLNGEWKMFEANGKQYDKKATITQQGTTVNLNNGYGSNASVSLQGSTIAVTAWGLTGTVSADGKRIDWSNGYRWERYNIFDRPEIEVVQETPTPTPAPTPIPTPTPVPNNRTLTLRNGGAMTVTVNVYKAVSGASDSLPVASIKYIDGGGSPSTSFGANLPRAAELDVEITMKAAAGIGTMDVPIYRGRVAAGASTLCFAVSGSVYEAFVKPCDNTVATENDYVTVRNEGVMIANVEVVYTGGTINNGDTKKIAKIDDTLLGYIRKIYTPRDAASAPRTLNFYGRGSDQSGTTFTKEFGANEKLSGCYKFWGSSVFPKVSPCSISSSARTMRFWNNSAGTAYLEITYDDSQIVRTGILSVGQAESIEVPASKTKSPIKVAYIDSFNGRGEVLRRSVPITVPYSFTGEVCFKLEGGLYSDAFSTCDDVVGDVITESRKIRFQNDAGYDASMVVTFWETQIINGQSVPMPKTFSTGMLNGLGGKFRLVALPLKTAKGMPITISIVASTTLRNNVFSTTLDADFAGSPQPCFKVWGTLFDPQGGKCDQ